MNNRIAISTPDPNTLHISHSRRDAVVGLLGAVVIVALWYLAPFAVLHNVREAIGNEVLYTVYLLTPILFLLPFLRLARTAIAGNEYTFEASQRMVLHNGRLLARFDDVLAVELHSRLGGDDPLHRVVLPMADNSTIVLAESRHEAAVRPLAQRVGAMLGRVVLQR